MSPTGANLNCQTAAPFVLVRVDGRVVVATLDAGHTNHVGIARLPGGKYVDLSTQRNHRLVRLRVGRHRQLIGRSRSVLRRASSVRHNR